jgi:hypothetical protein
LFFVFFVRRLSGARGFALGGGGARLRFEPHAGPVLAVAASPFHRLLFASAGADGALRLSSLLQPKPLCQLDASSAGKGARSCAVPTQSSLFARLFWGALLA